MWPSVPALVLQQPPAKAELFRILADAPKATDYPNAAKATLLDAADVTVRADGSARIVTHQRIKVLNARGREQEAEIQLPYNGSYETLRLIQARTIRPDGSVVAVRPTDVRQGSSEGYDDAKVLSFSMPAVEPGCVIDYEYVTEQKTSPLPGHFWFQWYFQGGLDPVQKTRLTVTVPKSLKLARRLRNSTIEPTLRNTPDGSGVVYTWEQSKVPPLEIEPLMPPSERQLPKLTLSTVPSWQTVAEWYTKLAKERMQSDPSVAAMAKELTKNCRTDEEKAKAIFYYVQEKTRYVAIELGISAYQPRAASRTLTVQYGDCKDMATLLVAMLRAVGLTADPVLLQANAPFPLKDELPTPHAFNHALCRVELAGKPYWLDATAQVCRFGDVPLADRGSEAFVVRDGKGSFEKIPLATPDQATTDQRVAITLLPEGSARGTVTLSGNGDYELELRANLVVKTPDETKKYLEALLSSIGVNPKLGPYQLSKVSDRDVSVTLTADALFPSWANVSGDLLIFKARADQTSPTFASPFTEESRLYPIYQSQPRLMRTTLTVALPSGYTVLYAPKNAQGESALGSYQRIVQNDGKTLTITLDVRDNQTTVPVSEYAAVRKYIESYLRTYNELVILKKAETQP